MSQVLVELDLPKDWRQFRLPPALDLRLQLLGLAFRHIAIKGRIRQLAKAAIPGPN